MILYASYLGHIRHSVSIRAPFRHTIGQFLVVIHGLEEKIVSKLIRYVFLTPVWMSFNSETYEVITEI